ncbi:hypothetical protein BWGOE4_32350 [Bacillus mycoides]|uniref:Imm30 family immunity protein n=1 Tax=Bacillus mycoides TaxID=1405 RepID=UPI00087295C8|nr:Imm30 family immunity protein [Bacillus mycoides]OFD56168.1 hypothetical protein BWGOE4_32350 [Bacillus mycoides]OFD63324.1 hypothetical protein BWGOE7_32020 [Bacillus mycoides]OFD94535.1 hypothetical protein BWGOE12_31540 [Bacillus mycoides]
MDTQEYVKRLYDSHLLQNENEIREFNESCIRVIECNDVSVIPDLCLVFDDDTEQFDVMFSLIHGIESLYENNIEEGLKYIATAAPSMMSGAKDWVEIIHYRILNNPQIRTVYGKVLSQFNPSITSGIKELLLEIKNEDPDIFSESVNEVIKLI